jgi:hypothetical protein
MYNTHSFLTFESFSFNTPSVHVILPHSSFGRPRQKTWRHAGPAVYPNSDIFKIATKWPHNQISTIVLRNKHPLPWTKLPSSYESFSTTSAQYKTKRVHPNGYTEKFPCCLIIRSPKSRMCEDIQSQIDSFYVRISLNILIVRSTPKHWPSSRIQVRFIGAEHTSRVPSSYLCWKGAFPCDILRLNACKCEGKN